WSWATNLLVTPAIAEVITTTWCPWSRVRLMNCATLRMRSASPTEVPPNLIVSRIALPPPKTPHGGSGIRKNSGVGPTEFLRIPLRREALNLQPTLQFVQPNQVLVTSWPVPPCCLASAHC